MTTHYKAGLPKGGRGWIKKVIFALVALLILVYATSSIAWLRVTKVIRTGSDIVPAENLLDDLRTTASGRWFGIFHKDSIFFFSEERFIEAIKNREPRIEVVTTQFQFPSTLQVTLGTYTVAGYWQSQNRWFQISASGELVAEVANGDSGVPAITSRGNLSPNVIHDHVIDEPLLAYIQAVHADIHEDTRIEPIAYDIGEAQKFTVRIDTKQGWYVLLSTNEDPHVQAQKVKLFLEETARRDASALSKIHYIDARFGLSRVYYE